VHADLACQIKLLDQVGIDQTVHLNDHARRAPGAGMVRFFADLREEIISQANRREQQMIEFLRPGVTGE